MKKKLRIYLDTSVFGGVYDLGFEADSRKVFKAIEDGKVTVLISEVVITELEPAPRAVKDLLAKIPRIHLEEVSFDRHVLSLRKAYLDAKVVTAKSKDDAGHVAAATVARADAIVSWNFKHIVRLDRMKGFNQVNFEQGYANLTIISPKEFEVGEE